MHDHAALAGLGALLARTGYRQAASIAYRELTSLYPDDAAARVCLGNVLHQLGQPGAALREYQAALAVEPDLAPAHQGLGDLYAATGRTALARQHWERGYAQHVFNPWPFTGEAAPIRVLLLFSVAGGNLRARTMLDETVFAVTAVAAEFWRPEHGLPPHDLILNAIADADLCAVALRQAARLLAETTAPVINNPDAVARTGRADNAARLAGMPDVAAPRMALVSRDDLAAADGVGVLAAHGLGLPVLLRAPGFHTGQHFTRVSRPDALRAAALDMPDTAVLAIEFLNAAGPDGCFRKGRVMIMDGALYPLHWAVSVDWKVHYFTAGMQAHEAHRQEEARFLDDMDRFLGARAILGLQAIAATLKLDYGGIDFALDGDGRVIVFEANACMVIVPPPDGEIWDYRRAATLRAQDAVAAMLRRRASQKTIETWLALPAWSATAS